MIILILFLGLILRVVLINQSLWLDEAAQVIESARPLSSQLSIAGDFQPPLFHLLLHFWMKLGTSEIWMRILTVLISIFSIYLFYKIGEKLINRSFALLTSFLFVLNPFAVYYAQELRPYPLTVLVSLIAIRGIVSNSAVLVILGLTLFLYTTYFAPFFILSLFVYFYFWQKKRFKWFSKNVIVSFVLFFPWLPSFLEQLRIGSSLTSSLPGWAEAVSTPVIKAIPLIFAKFFLGRITIDNKVIYALVVFSLISGFVYLAFKGYKNKQFSLFGSLFFLPLIFAFATSFFLPVIEPKRLLFVLPFFIAIVGLGIHYLPSLIKRVALFFVVFASLYGLFSYYTQPRFQREHWREAVSFVETKGDGSQLALFSFPQAFAPYLWYQHNIIESYAVAKNFVVSEDDLIQLRVVIKNRKRLYLFQYLTQLTDPANKIGKTIEEEGFVRIDTYDFPGVGFIYQYDKVSLALAP